MNSVSLHQLLVECHILHKKLNPGNLVRCSHFTKDVIECVGVALAVISRNSNSENNDGSTGCLAGADNLVEVALHALGGEPSKSVVATQLENDQRGAERLEGTLNSGRAPLRGFAADAGVNHSMFVPLAFQARLQQRGPGLVNVYTESCAEAVTEHEYSWSLRTVRVDS